MRGLSDLQASNCTGSTAHVVTFSRNTRAQLKQVFDALRELATPPDPPKRPIGFVTPEDTSQKTPGKQSSIHDKALKPAAPRR